MMVERSRGTRGGGYDIAINPTRQEWATNFPNGAAGTFMKDGTLVVGDGACLDHITLVRMAGLSEDNEKHRLQIVDGVAYVELWEEGLGDEERFVAEEGDGSPEWVERHTKYPKAVRASIAEELLISPYIKRLGLRVGVMIEDSLGTNHPTDPVWLKEIY